MVTFSRTFFPIRLNSYAPGNGVQRTRSHSISLVLNSFMAEYFTVGDFSCGSLDLQGICMPRDLYLLHVSFPATVWFPEC